MLPTARVYNRTQEKLSTSSPTKHDRSIVQQLNHTLFLSRGEWSLPIVTLQDFNSPAHLAVVANYPVEIAVLSETIEAKRVLMRFIPMQILVDGYFVFHELEWTRPRRCAPGTAAVGRCRRSTRCCRAKRFVGMLRGAPNTIGRRGRSCGVFGQAFQPEDCII